MDCLSTATLYAMGKIDVCVEGLSLDQLPSVLQTLNIQVYHLKRISYTKVEFCMVAKDFKKLRKILRGRAWKVKIISKNGLPFSAVSRLKRRVILIAMAFGVGIIFFLASRIWRIEVTGCHNIPAWAIKQQLRYAGFYEGMANDRGRFAQWEYKLRNEFSLLSWVGFELDGVRLRVRVVEKQLQPHIVKKNQGDIVALEDGIVTDIIVRRGKAMVKVGDRVQAGQVIIAGKISWATGEMATYADGIVMAKIYRNATSTSPLTYLVDQPTGNIAKQRMIVFCGWQIPLTSVQPYKQYDVKNERTNFGGDGFLLPIYLENRLYIETKTQSQKVNAEQILPQLAKIAQENAQKLLPTASAVVDKRIAYDIINTKTIKVVAWVEAIMDIAARPLP